MNKRSPKPDPYGSTGGRHEHYGRLFESMLKSDIYKSLTTGEKQVYTCCRVQANTEKGKQSLYKHGIENGRAYDPERDFVFSAKHAAEYGINRFFLSRCMKVLIEKGFIEKREANQYQHKVNVYSFSDKWKSRVTDKQQSRDI